MFLANSGVIVIIRTSKPLAQCLASNLRFLMLQGNRVSEWLKHSVQLPQYVPAFRENSITVRPKLPLLDSSNLQMATDSPLIWLQSLDFPTLVNDQGATLEVDLGVSNQLFLSKDALHEVLCCSCRCVGRNEGLLIR